MTPKFESYPPSNSNSSQTAANSVAIKYLVEQVSEGLKDIKVIVNNLQIQHQSLAIDVGSTKTDIDNLHDTVGELNKIIREGNGRESVLTRLALIEKSQEEIKKVLDRSDSNKKQNDTNTWQFKTAVATGILALITAIASAYIQLMK